MFDKSSDVTDDVINAASEKMMVSAGSNEVKLKFMKNERMLFRVSGAFSIMLGLFFLVEHYNYIYINDYLLLNFFAGFAFIMPFVFVSIVLAKFLSVSGCAIFLKPLLIYLFIYIFIYLLLPFNSDFTTPSKQVAAMVLSMVYIPFSLLSIIVAKIFAMR